MELLILLAGIADPRKALPAVIDAASLAAYRASCATLSPFDEAALELALKLRDGAPDTRITALVGASGTSDPLLQRVGSFRIDELIGFSLADHPAWDTNALATELIGWVRTMKTKPELILMGREFGDEDDGTLPALLAETLSRPLVSQALLVESSDGVHEVLRQHDSGLERLRVRGPAVIAATNHADNRLRHPLLKNVMAAKKTRYALTEIPLHRANSTLTHISVRGISQPQRAKDCHLLNGSIHEQAAQLARELMRVMN